jgi:hypothetical protein
MTTAPTLAAAAPALPAAPATAPQPWSLGRHFMLRVAGLPAEVVEPLRCPRTLAWAELVLAEEARLRAQVDDLSDALAEAIGTVADAPARRALVGLRRAVFNDRCHLQPGAAREAAAALEEPLRDRLTHWLDHRVRLETLRGLGAVLLADEVDAASAHLRRIAADDRLRRGLLLASPVLDGQLDGYLADAASRRDKRTRKVERSVLAYLYRTACKTSPFSTFTGVVPGELGAATEQRDPTVAGGWASSVRLNVVVLARLAELVLADPERRADLPVTVTSGWRREGGAGADRVRYVRRSVHAGDDTASVTFDAARDQLFFLRRSRVLDRLLAALDADEDGEGDGEVRYRTLATRLAAELDADVEECEHYLADLLDLGILQAPVLATRVHRTDPLGAFREALAGLGRPWADRLAATLEGPARCVAAYPAAGTAARRRLLRELREGLRAAVAELGAPDATLPHTLLYEDVRAGEGLVTWDRSEWEGLLAGPLRTLDRVLPAFDLSLRHRLTLHGFFLARYGVGGRCDDVLRLVHEFHEDLYEEYQSFTARRPRVDEDGAVVRDPNWMGLAAVRAVDDARALWVRRLDGLARAHPAAEELVLDEGAGGGVAGEVAAALDGGDGAGGGGIRGGGVGAGGGMAGVPGGFRGRTHFVQRGETADGPVLVHNGAFGGMTFPFSRFTHCLDADAPEGAGLVDRLREEARRRQPEGVVFAEVTGGSATSNLNLHAPLVDHEIVGPGDVSDAAEERRIRLSDLFVEHDPGEDRLVLRSRGLGREVVPVYQGYLVPQALPAVPRTLLLLSPSATLAFDPWAGVPEPPAEDGVVSRPRLRIGSLVVSRRTWATTAASLPRGATTPEQRFLGWQAWRRRHGIPGRVFVRVQAQGATPGPGRAKPQYVDFASHHALLGLEGLLTDDDDRVELTEMLPGPGQLHVGSAEGRHVAEAAFETFTSVLPDRPESPLR